MDELAKPARPNVRDLLRQRLGAVSAVHTIDGICRFVNSLTIGRAPLLHKAAARCGAQQGAYYTVAQWKTPCTM